MTEPIQRSPFELNQGEPVAQQPTQFANPNGALAVTDTTQPWDYKGRFGRLSYLAWRLVESLIVFVLMFVVFIFMGVGTGLSAAMTGGSQNAVSNVMAGIGGLTVLLFLVIFLASMVFGIIMGIRRLHDCNRSGHLMWLFLVPLVNIGLGLYLLFAPGTPGPNRFGPARVTPEWEKVVGYIYIGFIVLSLLVSFLMFGSIMAMVATRAH